MSGGSCCTKKKWGSKSQSCFSWWSSLGASLLHFYLENLANANNWKKILYTFLAGSYTMRFKSLCPPAGKAYQFSQASVVRKSHLCTVFICDASHSFQLQDAMTQNYLVVKLAKLFVSSVLHPQTELFVWVLFSLIISWSMSGKFRLSWLVAAPKFHSIKLSFSIDTEFYGIISTYTVV